jgi:nitrilase
VVARASDGPGWTTGRLDRALTARVRANMPVIEHRRL